MQAQECHTNHQHRQGGQTHQCEKFKADSRHESLLSVWNIAHRPVYTDFFVLVSTHLRGWISACEELPSTLVRLVCIAKRRRSGEVAEQALKFTETEALLARYYRWVFRLWLALPLSDKVDDALPYLTTLAGLEDELTSLEVERFILSLIPPDVSEMEKSLFINHLRGIFEIFCEWESGPS
jgi:hypothetical protein